jgi:hypothetical protein
MRRPVRFLLWTMVSLAGLAFVTLGYMTTIGNAGVLYQDCTSSPPRLTVVDQQPQWRWWFPPRYVCLYRTDDGRTVERRS